jgi:MFS family permease
VKSLGGTSVEIGLIDGVANAVAALVRLPSGAVSDVVGRRPLVLLGYGISAIIRPLMGLVGSPMEVIFVRMADRFGKGIRSGPRDALVSDLVEPASRGRAFGHIRAMDHGGAALGPLVAMLFLLAFPGRERLLFLLALLPGLVTLAVIWMTVRDAPSRMAAAPRTALTSLLSRSQSSLLGSVGVWSLGAASEQFLLLRAADLGVPAALVPLVWLVMSLTKSSSASLCGSLADRWHPRLALAAGAGGSLVVLCDDRVARRGGLRVAARLGERATRLGQGNRNGILTCRLSQAASCCKPTSADTPTRQCGDRSPSTGHLPCGTWSSCGSIRAGACRR